MATSQQVLDQITAMIQDQIADQQDNEVEELSLDMVNIGKFTPEIQKLFEKYENLASLSLNGCNLRSLENFPELKQLIRLELIDNKLTGNTLSQLKQYETLQSLSLGGNHIKSYEDLNALKNLPNLFQLDLINNDITKLSDYRQTLFDKFPSLGILDNLNPEGKEVEYDDDVSGEEDEEEDDEDDEEDEDEEGDEEQQFDGEEEEDDDEEEDDEEDDEDDDEEQINKKQNN